MPSKRRAKPLCREDKAFFQTFYEEHKNFLFYIARQYTQDLSDCEDIVQDSILRLMANVTSLKDLSSGAAAKYIALTVRTAYLDWAKRKSRQQEIPTDHQILEQLLEQDPLPDNITAAGELQALKESLSSRDWLVLEGKYILGYSQEELGELIGVTPDSIRMILHRARIKARDILLHDKGGDHRG